MVVGFGGLLGLWWWVLVVCGGGSIVVVQLFFFFFFYRLWVMLVSRKGGRVVE